MAEQDRGQLAPQAGLSWRGPAPVAIVRHAGALRLVLSWRSVVSDGASCLTTWGAHAAVVLVRMDLAQSIASKEAS